MHSKDHLKRIQSADLFGIPSILTEQVPDKLGCTDTSLSLFVSTVMGPNFRKLFLRHHWTILRCKIITCPTNVEHIEDCWRVHYNDSCKITWWILARKMNRDRHKTYWCITNVPVGIVSMTNQWGASMWRQGIFLWLTDVWCNIYFCFNEHAFCHEGF